jgi:hypothetical protein
MLLSVSVTRRGGLQDVQSCSDSEEEFVIVACICCRRLAGCLHRAGCVGFTKGYRIRVYCRKLSELR